MLRRWVLAPCIAAAACTDEPLPRDRFPIHVDASTEALLVMVQDREDMVLASVDVLSPITVRDSGPDGAVRRDRRRLTLRGLIGDGPTTVPRGVLDADILHFHPCEGPCQVGRPPKTTTVEMVLGADALASGALRLDFPNSDLYLLPNIAGDTAARGRICDAVFPSPFRGGGTLFVGGAELPFGGRRIALGACLTPQPPPEPPPPEMPSASRGADVLLVVSTGLGVTVISTAAYERWRDSHPKNQRPPSSDSLQTTDQVYLPSGLITGKLTTLPGLALVGSGGGDSRGPCREVQAHRLLAVQDCQAGDCPCSGGDTFCRVPAVLELTPKNRIEVLVVPDADPTLQSLRAELRPDQAEVDGILGTLALHDTQIDIDYPNNRVLARCPSSDTCQSRPLMLERADRDVVSPCLGSDP